MPKIKLLKTIYVDLLVLIMILIVLTPYLVQGGISVLQEEVVEGIIIALLFMTGYAIYIFYTRAVASAEKQVQAIEQDNTALQNRIDETFKYIGALNVQISEIEEVFAAIKNYPESKKDFKEVLEFLSTKILNIVHTPWVLLRIVDLKDDSTIREFCGIRAGAVLLKHEIHNTALVQGTLPTEVLVHTSDQNNLTIKAYCSFPELTLTREQNIFLKAITNQLEMLFIVFSSPYTVHQPEVNMQEKTQPVTTTSISQKKGIFSFPFQPKKAKNIDTSIRGTSYDVTDETPVSIDL